VAGRILVAMGTKSREAIYGASVRAAAERAAEARKEGSRPFGLRGMEQADARLSGTGAAFSCIGRRTECRLPLSRSEMLGLQHASNRAAEYSPPTEGYANP